MGRKLAAIMLILCFGAAAGVFFTRERKVLRDSIDTKAHDHRVIIQGFTTLNYEDGALVSKLSAKKGRYIEPNMMDLEGDVKGERYSDTSKETMRSDQATVYLRTTSLSNLMSQEAELDRAELTGFVQVGFKDHILSTDYAEYIQRENVIRSSKPVQVNGPLRYFESESGFAYSLTTEMLEMTGRVKGVTTVEESPK